MSFALLNKLKMYSKTGQILTSDQSIKVHVVGTLNCDHNMRIMSFTCNNPVVIKFDISNSISVH